MTSGGGGTQQTSTTSGPPPQVLANYQQLVGATENQAAQPLSFYQGPMVAGFTPDQQAAFSGIEQAQGVQVPYLNAAAQEYGSATTPLWPTLPQTDTNYAQQIGVTGVGVGQGNAANATGIAQNLPNTVAPYVNFAGNTAAGQVANFAGAAPGIASPSVGFANTEAGQASGFAQAAPSVVAPTVGFGTNATGTAFNTATGIAPGTAPYQGAAGQQSGTAFQTGAALPGSTVPFQGQAAGAGQQAIGIGQNIPGATAPYQGFGQGAAGSAFGTAAGIGGGAAPYQQAGTNYQIGQYLSPYTQNVTQALQGLFNQQNATQLQQVRGNATAQGAYGGDREAVAEALTAQQQQLAEAPALAQVLQQGFQGAQQETNTQQGLALQAGQLGVGAGQASTQGQVAAGNLGIGAGQLGVGANQAAIQGVTAGGQLGATAGQLGIGATQAATGAELGAAQNTLGIGNLGIAANQAGISGELGATQAQTGIGQLGLGANTAALQGVLGAGGLGLQSGQEALASNQQALQGWQAAGGLGLQAGQENLGANTAALQGVLGGGQLGLATGQAGYGEFNQQQQAQLAAEQANAWLSSQAGFGMASLGNEAQNAALTQAGAMMQAGGMQQQLGQEQLNIPYQQFEAAQAYPYQTLGFMAPIIEGTGSLSGGIGQTNYPGASPISQVAGAGLTGLGLYGLANQSGLFGSSMSDFPALTASNIAGTTSDMLGAFNAAAARGGRVGKAIGGPITHAHRAIGGMPTDIGSPTTGIGGGGMMPTNVPAIGGGMSRGIGGAPTNIGADTSLSVSSNMPTDQGPSGVSATMPAPPTGVSGAVPDANYLASLLSPPPSPAGAAAAAKPSSMGLSTAQPQVTQTTTSDSGGGGILGAIGPLITLGKLALMAFNAGGRVHFDDGGPVIPGQMSIGSYSNDQQKRQQQNKGIGLPVIPQFTLDDIIHPGPQVKGSGPPHPPSAPTGSPSSSGGIDAAGLLGDMKSVKQIGGFGSGSGSDSGGDFGGGGDYSTSARGGRIGLQYGGSGGGPTGGVPASIMAQYGGAPPGIQNQLQQLILLPLQRLQEMAVQYPANTQTGQMIQTAIKQKEATPGSGTAPATPQSPGGQQQVTAMPQSQPAQQQIGGTNQPMMQPTGGTSYAAGGGVGGYVMPDELDPVPVVDHSGDTVKIRFPSEGKVLDLGLPPVQRPHAATGGQFKGTITAGNGVSIPLLNDDGTWGANSLSAWSPLNQQGYQPGGGAGGWFQPLQQFRPEGTQFINGALALPSTPAWTPNEGPIAQSFGFQVSPAFQQQQSPSGGGGGNNNNSPPPDPLTPAQRAFLGFGGPGQPADWATAMFGPGGAPDNSGGSGGGGKRGGRFGFDDGGDTGTTDMTPTTDDTGSEAWVPAEKHTLGEAIAKDYHAMVDQPPPIPADKDVAAVMGDTGGLDEGPRRGRIGAPSVTSPDQPKPNVYGDVNPMQGQMRGIGMPTAEEPKGFVPKPKEAPTSDRMIEGAPVIGDIIPPPSAIKPPTPTKGIGQSLDPVTGNPIPPPEPIIGAPSGAENAPPLKVPPSGNEGAGDLRSTAGTVPLPPVTPPAAAAPATRAPQVAPPGSYAPPAPAPRNIGQPQVQPIPVAPVSPPPARQWLAVGDSLAGQMIRTGQASGTHQTIDQVKASGDNPQFDAADGRSMSGTRASIEFNLQRDPNYYRGKYVRLSPGTSNAPGELDSNLQPIIDRLKSAGAAGIQLVGVGDTKGVEDGKLQDLNPLNAKLAAAAKQNGLGFTGAIHGAIVHPNPGYWGKIPAEAPPAPQQVAAAAPQGQPAPRGIGMPMGGGEGEGMPEPGIGRTVAAAPPSGAEGAPGPTPATAPTGPRDTIIPPGAPPPGGTYKPGDFIKHFEGPSLVHYADPGGGRDAVGYGHNITEQERAQGYIDTPAGRVPTTGNITDRQQEAIFTADWNNSVAGIQKDYGLDVSKLNTNQQEALVSYYYNTGKLPNGITQKITAGDMQGAAEMLRNGIKTGQGMPGEPLAGRRAAEAELFMLPEGQHLAQYPAPAPGSGGGGGRGASPTISDTPSGMRGIGMDVGQPGRGIGMRNEYDDLAAQHGRHPFSLSDYAMPLLIAGLTTLGSRSPNALGEGFKAAAPFFTAQERTNAALENADVRRNAAAQTGEYRMQMLADRAATAQRNAEVAWARLNETAASHQANETLRQQAMEYQRQAREMTNAYNMAKIQMDAEAYTTPQYTEKGPNGGPGMWYPRKRPDTSLPNGGAIFVEGVGAPKAATGVRGVYQDLVAGGFAKDEAEAIRVYEDLKANPRSQKNATVIAGLIGREVQAQKSQQFITGKSDADIEADARKAVAERLQAGGAQAAPAAQPAAPAAAAPAQPTAPAKAPPPNGHQTVEQNGHTYIWDGAQYVPQPGA